MGRPLVPMTDEEQEKLMDLKDRHRSGVKELQELQEKRKELHKHRDELLYRRRCLAARFVNRIVLHSLDSDYARHQLRIGLKLGGRLPEELKNARMPISRILFFCADMGRAMVMGMDAYIAEFHSLQENLKKKRMQQHEEKEAENLKKKQMQQHEENEVEAETACDPVAQEQ